MRQQFGIVASDPLRLLGMRTLFEKKSADVVVLTGDYAALVPSLSLVLIDAACTDDVFGRMAEFRQWAPSLKIMVLGLERDAIFIERVIGAGANGYLTHDALEDEILMAVDIVLDDSVWAPRKVLARLIESDQVARQRLAAQPTFTKRERDVLRLLIGGSTNRQIGEALSIDEATVKAHVGRLMRKVGVTNRTALSLRAMEWQEREDADSAASSGR